MSEYHKIQTVFLRDQENKHKTLLEGQYSLPEFEYLKDNEWVFTEKVDGTNIRVIVQGDGSVEYGGKSENAQIPARLINALDAIFRPMKELLSQVFEDGAILYGEGYGAKIQKGGGNYRQDQSFVLFDVQVGEWWLQRNNVHDVASKLNLDVVPEIGKGNLSDMVDMVKDGITSTWGDFQAEGIVARPSTELKTRGGDRVITKIKCKDFKQ